MNFELLPLELADFLNCGWRDSVDACEEKRCPYISLQLGKASAEAEKQGNSKQEMALLVLTHLCGLRHNTENKSDPYHIQEKRELISKYGGLLIEFVKTIDCAEVKSRLCDLLFFYSSPRHYHSSQLAIDAYIEAALEVTSVNVV